MSMRVKAALVIMAIVSVFTAASFVLSISFTRINMKEAMEQDFSLALDLADSLVSTKITLLKSDANTVAERLLRADSAEEMLEIVAVQTDRLTNFTSLTVLDRNGIIANYGQPTCAAMLYGESKYPQQGFAGEDSISPTH